MTNLTPSIICEKIKITTEQARRLSIFLFEKTLNFSKNGEIDSVSSVRIGKLEIKLIVNKSIF